MRLIQKFYSSKSNAVRGARLFDVASVEEVDGKWAVVTHEESSDADDESNEAQAAEDADVDLAQPAAVDLVRVKSFATSRRAFAAAAKLPGAEVLQEGPLWVVWASADAAAVNERPAKHSGGSVTEPNERMAKVIELASRSGGTTRKELDSAVGGPTRAPWTQTLQRAARRSGYRLVISKDGQTAIYRLVA